MFQVETGISNKSRDYKSVQNANIENIILPFVSYFTSPFFRHFVLLENGSKKSIFNWVLKFDLD